MGLDTYQICIQARFDTYQIPFLTKKIQRKTLKRAPNTALRFTHVRERKLAVPPFDYSDLSFRTGKDTISKRPLSPNPTQRQRAWNTGTNSRNNMEPPLLPVSLEIGLFIKTKSLEAQLGNGRGTVGKRAGPKWSKQPFWSKWPHSELDFSIRETKMVHFGPFWPEEVHFGPFRSANRTPAIPDQQRHLSSILVAIVSQNSFVLVFVGYRTIIARYVAKWGIAQMCLCETKYQEGGIAPFLGGVLTFALKGIARYGVSQRNIARYGATKTKSLLLGTKLSGTGDLQRDSRESIRANHSHLKPLFL